MTPQEQLADPSPKCGNCRYWASVMASKKPHIGPLQAFGLRKIDEPPSTPVPGKGACREPHVAPSASTQLFYVTDLSVCSLWEPKEA